MPFRHEYSTAIEADDSQPEDFQMWETCMTINNTWAYNMHDREVQVVAISHSSFSGSGKAAAEIFCLTWAHNPTVLFRARIQELSALRGLALRSTVIPSMEPPMGPIQGLGPVRATAKNEKVFVHVFDWPSSSLEINGLEPKSTSAHLLANGQRLKFRQAEGKLQIDLPPQPPDPNVSVIALRTSVAALIRLKLIGLLSLRGAICSCVQHLQCCSDFRIVRGEFLRLKHLGKPFFQIARAAVDQPEIFVEKGQGAAVSAQREPFLQLCNGLRPIMSSCRSEREIAERLSANP